MSKLWLLKALCVVTLLHLIVYVCVWYKTGLEPFTPFSAALWLVSCLLVFLLWIFVGLSKKIR